MRKKQPEPGDISLSCTISQDAGAESQKPQEEELMGLSDGHWTRCMVCTAFPRDLLQKSSSSDASRGEGAGTWVKPMFPMVPHSSGLDIGHIHAGNREWVVVEDQSAPGKLVSTQWTDFESKRSVLEKGEANRQGWCW